MNKNLKAALIVAAVLALLASYGAYLMNERSAMTAAATGTVLKSEFVPDSESSSLDETRIAYSFDANGSRVEGSDSISGADRTAAYPPGRTVQLCYDPKEPQSSRLNLGDPCG